MKIPVPWAILARIWNALRQNPCTIEIIEKSFNGQQRIRIRNDSLQPTDIIDVSFTWWLRRWRRSYCTPTEWSSSEQTLDPGRSFEHPVDAHEVGEVPTWCEVKVHHNRSAHPATRIFRPRLSRAHLRRLKSRAQA